jgi:hypothetical protein
MRKLLVFAAFAAMLAVDAAAWNLVPCSAQSIAKRAEYQHRLAGAPSGSLNWIPYPFPHNDAQAIEDFRHQYLDIWGHKQATDTARRHFVDSLSANTLKFDVYRVENWRSNRCDSPMNGDFFFLLRMRDGATGQEIARADLYDSGVFASIAIAPADLPRATIDAHINQHEIADPAVVANRNAALGPHDAQLITAYGSLTCDTLTPCVAFRSAGNIYVQKNDELFRFDAAARRISWLRELRDEHAKQNLMRTLAAQGQRILSLGADDFVALDKVQ